MTPARPYFRASVDLIEDMMKLHHMEMEIVNVTFDPQTRTVCFEIGGLAAQAAVQQSGEPAPQIRIQYIKDGKDFEPSLTPIFSIFPKV